MTDMTTKKAEINLYVEDGSPTLLGVFDLRIEDENTVYGSSIAFGLAKALKSQLEHIQDDTWKRQIHAWLFPTAAKTDPVAHDSVNHPSHYTSDPSGVECIQITRHRDFLVGNAIKYLWRAGLKTDADKSALDKEIEDVEKSIWYLNERIKLLRESY